MVEQINTELHTDLLNETTRNQVIRDINGLIQLPADIVRAIQATTENEGSNFLDNLVGILRNTDANLIKYQEMNKQYKELQNLPDELKAENSKKLASDMANAVKSTYGIDDDVEIVINFTDQPKDSEMAAFVREDKKIEIYLNVKEVDVSDMEQVYNALGAELNHYNTSNPYVYDKTEEQAGKGNLQEELFTSIGRKPLDGSGNSFYEDVLNGSGTLESGNSQYSNIIEELLDFAQGYHPSGLAETSDEHNRRVSEQNRYRNERKKLEDSLSDCSGKRCEYIYNKLAEIDGKYDPVKGIFYDGKQDTGDSTKNKNVGNNGKAKTTPVSKDNLTVITKSEKDIKYSESDIDKIMINAGYKQGQYEVVKSVNGGYEIIVNGKIDDNDFKNLNNSNLQVVSKNDRRNPIQILTMLAVEEGKAPPYYMVSLQEQIKWSDNLANGVKTAKEAYNDGYLTKSEYYMANIYTTLSGTARTTEYLGIAYGAKNVYDYHLSGKGNQTASILITGKESNPNMGDNIAGNFSKQATVNPDSDTVVLGKFEWEKKAGMPKETSYNSVAQQKNATYFQIDNWDEISSKYGNEQMWKINKSFLEQQTALKKQ
jgi:hypothetical protein